jgi:hypothetical protein
VLFLPSPSVLNHLCVLYQVQNGHQRLNGVYDFLFIMWFTVAVAKTSNLVYVNK